MTPLFFFFRPWFSPFPQPGLELDTIELKACEIHEIYGLTTAWRVMKTTLVAGKSIDRDVHKINIEERVSDDDTEISITRL